MKIKRWTKEEDLLVVDCMNEYPGNYTYGAREASSKIKRSVNAILLRYRTIKWNYPSPICISPDGKRTPNGIYRWVSYPPEFAKIRRWNNIKHLFFS